MNEMNEIKTDETYQTLEKTYNEMAASTISMNEVSGITDSLTNLSSKEVFQDEGDIKQLDKHVSFEKEITHDKSAKNINTFNIKIPFCGLCTIQYIGLDEKDQETTEVSANENVNNELNIDVGIEQNIDTKKSMDSKEDIETKCEATEPEAKIEEMEITSSDNLHEEVEEREDIELVIEESKPGEHIEMGIEKSADQEGEMRDEDSDDQEGEMRDKDSNDQEGEKRDEDDKYVRTFGFSLLKKSKAREFSVIEESKPDEHIDTATEQETTEVSAIENVDNKNNIDTKNLIDSKEDIETKDATIPQAKIEGVRKFPEDDRRHDNIMVGSIKNNQMATTTNSMNEKSNITHSGNIHSNAQSNNEEEKSDYHVALKKVTLEVVVQDEGEGDIKQLDKHVSFEKEITHDKNSKNINNFIINALAQIHGIPISGFCTIQDIGLDEKDQETTEVSANENVNNELNIDVGIEQNIDTKKSMDSKEDIETKCEATDPEAKIEETGSKPDEHIEAAIEKSADQEGEKRDEDSDDQEGEKRDEDSDDQEGEKRDEDDKNVRTSDKKKTREFGFSIMKKSKAREFKFSLLNKSKAKNKKNSKELESLQNNKKTHDFDSNFCKKSMDTKEDIETKCAATDPEAKIEEMEITSSDNLHEEVEEREDIELVIEESKPGEHIEIAIEKSADQEGETRDEDSDDQEGEMRDEDNTNVHTSDKKKAREFGFSLLKKSKAREFSFALLNKSKAKNKNSKELESLQNNKITHDFDSYFYKLTVDATEIMNSGYTQSQTQMILYSREKNMKSLYYQRRGGRKKVIEEAIIFASCLVSQYKDKTSGMLKVGAENLIITDTTSEVPLPEEREESPPVPLLGYGTSNQMADKTPDVNRQGMHKKDISNSNRSVSVLTNSFSSKCSSFSNKRLMVQSDSIQNATFLDIHEYV